MSKHSIGNFIWLMNNHGGRYADMPVLEKQIAADLKKDRPEWVTRCKNGSQATSAADDARLLAGKAFKKEYPEFQDTWLAEKPQTFVRKMVSLGYGIWAGFQAMDEIPSTLVPPLARAGVVQEGDLARLFGRGQLRADVGLHVVADIPVSADVPIGRRFGISIQEPPHPLMKAVASGCATTILLSRTLGARVYEAAPCPQTGSTHLLTLDWEPLTRVSPEPNRRDPMAQLLVAKPAGGPLVAYGFEAPGMPQRIELVVAVFGSVIPELRRWSEDGGIGSPALNEALLRALAEDAPRVAGRLLVDIVKETADEERPGGYRLAHKFTERR